MRLYKDRYFLGLSIIAALVSFVLYDITKAPTVSFWDCGEFIATSYIMGVPHPPGYPMYVILGRLFSLLPIAGEIAVRVNLLSVVGGAASVFVAFWLILRIVIGRGEKPAGLAKIGLGIGALCGSLIMGLSRVFWSNAVEAEVYTLSMFLMLVINYLAILWAHSDPERKNDNLLILIAYLSWLSLGIHMTTFIIVLPAIIYMAYTDYRETGMRRWPIWVVFSMFVLYPLPLQTELLRILGVDISRYELESFITIFVTAFVAVSVVMIVFWLRESENLKAWLLTLVIMISAVVGYSNQAYIPIRAAEKPAINENAPYSWDRFKAFLERKQYGQESMFRRMFHRRGSWRNQLATDPRFGLLGILYEQYTSPEQKIPIFQAGNTDNGGGGVEISLSLAMVYIILLGLYGAYESIKRSPPDGFFIIGATLLCTIGLAIYMNFSDGVFNSRIAPIAEVRNRDYFYTPGFMYFAVLIGIGLSGLLRRIGGYANSARNYGKSLLVLFIIASLGSTAMAVNTAVSNFEHNDRRGNFLPHDYAKNILDSCAENAIIFTNGDNDTFPLWYIQEVEGFRTDVRVVNLSLLNTVWYIHQLKDEMKVPIGLPDDVIDDLHAFRIPNSDRIYRVQDQMVQQIISEIQDAGWNPPLYFALTVPSENRMGLEDHLIMEGLAYRVVETSGRDRIDTDVSMRIFGNPDNFRGIGDPSVTRDDNDRKLILNYAVAMFQVANEFYARGVFDSALTVAHTAVNLQGDDAPWQIYAYLARILAAADSLEEVARIAERSNEGENVYLFASQDLIKNAEFGKAERLLKMALERYPSSIAALNNLATIYFQRGDTASAYSLIEEFRSNNGSDPQMLKMADQVMERLQQIPLPEKRK